MFEAFDACFEVFDDFEGQVAGVWEVVEVGEVFVFYPGYIEAGFIAGDDFAVGVFAPAAVGVGVAPGFFAFLDVSGVVAMDKILERGKCEGVLFFGKVHIGAQIVEPHVIGPG